jgi:hypothetical protein
MPQHQMKASEDKEFIASDRWKCLKSPSGAHHWIINCDQMTCRYCRYSKSTDITRPGWPKPEEIKQLSENKDVILK